MRLKVFRTAIGFHDAYVAAPSRKAALSAWGTDKDLFARGAAEEVTDPALMAEPLSAPGTVFRRLRVTPPEAQAPKRKAGASRASAMSKPAKAEPMRPRPPPRPEPVEVEAARNELEQARQRHAAEQHEQESRERELAAARRVMEQRQSQELRVLEKTLQAAESDYAARLARWRKAAGSDADG